MPFNGAGLFIRVRNWVADAAAGVKIRADYHDVEDDGFAAGLSQCIARDGQSIVTNNIPMNGKRLTGLQNPIDPQDAATKAYADLKLPLAGGTITGNLDVTGAIGAVGYKTRPGTAGAYSGFLFNFNWIEGVGMEAWQGGFNWGVLATQSFATNAASTYAANAAAPKVNRAGDTMTGGLTVNGEMIAAAAYLRFQSSGGPGFIQWSGGGAYDLGGGGRIWHTGNLLPILNVRIVAGAGGVATGVSGMAVASGIAFVTGLTMGQLQAQNPNGWYAVSGG